MKFAHLPHFFVLLILLTATPGRSLHAQSNANNGTIAYALTAPTDPVAPGQVVEFDVTATNLTNQSGFLSVSLDATVPNGTTYPTYTGYGEPAGSRERVFNHNLNPGQSALEAILLTVNSGNQAPPDGTVITLTVQDRDRGASISRSVVVRSLSPVVNSALDLSVDAGQPFTYQITATNNPTGFSANGLPPGLSVNASTGVISGTPTVAGAFAVNLGASNSYGTGTAVLTLNITEPPFPIVTLTASIPTVAAGSGGVAQFTLNRSGGDLSQEVVIAYQINASGIPGVDYSTLSGTKKMKSGKASVRINVFPSNSLRGAGKKTVKLTLEPADGYIVGDPATAKVKILAP